MLFPALFQSDVLQLVNSRVLYVCSTTGCSTLIFLLSPGHGIAVGVAIALSCVIGLVMIYWVKGKAVNFFVAGRTLPLYVVCFALASSSIDSNALLGNANLSYKYQFWDGAVLPIGLGLSLILNGIFLAHKINKENVLTLPDVYAQKYGIIIEVMVSIVTIISFTMLLAGNLVGLGKDKTRDDCGTDLSFPFKVPCRTNHCRSRCNIVICLEYQQ